MGGQAGTNCNARGESNWNTILTFGGRKICVLIPRPSVLISKQHLLVPPTESPRMLLFWHHRTPQQSETERSVISFVLMTTYFSQTMSILENAVGKMESGTVRSQPARELGKIARVEARTYRGFLGGPFPETRGLNRQVDVENIN